MTFKADLHVHTMHSEDNDAEPRLIIQESINRGLDAVVFTEHNYYAASGYVERLRPEYSDRIVLIRGVEISACEGHCLVYGADPDGLALNGAAITEVVKAVNNLGAVAIPAHPFRGGSGIGQLLMRLKGIAAIEGYNGCNIHPMNTQAIEAARSLNLPFTGGSDAHAPKEVAMCYTAFKDRVNNERELAEALRVQDEEGGAIGQILVQLGYADREAVAQAVGEQHGIGSAICGEVLVAELNAGVSAAFAQAVKTVVTQNGIVPGVET